VEGTATHTSLAAETAATETDGGDPGDLRVNTSILHQTIQGSFDGTMPFPTVVGILHEDGVERYYADLVQLKKTYYGGDGAVRTNALPLTEPPAIPDAFDASVVREALVAIQGGRITYPEFLRRIMAAGTASYTVFLAGQRTVYWGRHGDCHIEEFGPRT
jgi:uncharacterized protein YbcV (DUF1398 family)